MQKGKMQYAMAGVQMQPAMVMNVRSNVRVPDAEAGCDAYESRTPYRAEQAPPAARPQPSLPYRVAIPFLLVLFLAFFWMTADKLIQRSQLSGNIDAMESSIKVLTAENMVLTEQVKANRDQARIGYLAQQMRLISSDGVETVMVIAPDTRPQEAQMTVTGISPLPDGQGMISGSR
ncbi:MAG: hypothetical protein E7324_06685 [Clostridiales bacterium]|nr:hypothetical protein [Clostridiales bacterium]